MTLQIAMFAKHSQLGTEKTSAGGRPRDNTTRSGARSTDTVELKSTAASSEDELTAPGMNPGAAFSASTT